MTMLTPETNDALLGCTGTETRVFLVLRWHRNLETKGSYPSIRRISRLLGVTDPTTLSGIQGLEAKGLIRRSTPRRGQITTYSFPLEDGVQAHLNTDGKSVKAGFNGGVQIQPLEVLKSGPESVKARPHLNGENGVRNGGIPPLPSASPLPKSSQATPLQELADPGCQTCWGTGNRANEEQQKNGVSCPCPCINRALSAGEPR